MAALFLVTRKPVSKKEHHRHLCELGRLKQGMAAITEPAAGAVDAHAYRRHITKREGDDNRAQPYPPSALPEVVIDQRGDDTNDKARCQPYRLVFDEKINITLIVLGEGA